MLHASFFGKTTVLVLVLCYCFIIESVINYGCVNSVAVVLAGDLRNALHDYELLHHMSFQHRIHKRDLYTPDPDAREVEYDSFGRLAESTGYHCFTYHCCSMFIIIMPLPPKTFGAGFILFSGVSVCE